MKIGFEGHKKALSKVDLLLVIATKHSKKVGKSEKKIPRAVARPTFSNLDRKVALKLDLLLKEQAFGFEYLESTTFRPSLTSNSKALVVVGWSESVKSDRFEQIEKVRKFGAFVYESARKLSARTVLISGEGIQWSDASLLRAFVEGLMLSSYEFTTYQTPAKKAKKVELASVQICTEYKGDKSVLRDAQADCRAVMKARDLINIPPNYLRPTDFVGHCKEVAREQKLAIEILGPVQLKKLGAGGLLAVAAASTDKPYLVKLSYSPKGSLKNDSHLTLIGKTITFDSGGFAIKTLGGMEHMKCDMSGGAAVLSAMHAIAERALPVKVVAYLAIAENMISGEAMRPGDVLRMPNGKSVEMLNPDAEGRLVLADALCLAAREKPAAMVDVATLTGASAVALGSKYAALFANNDALAEALVQSGVESGERFWRMPLAPEYKKVLKSPVADLKNTFGPQGGAITAALFLEEFVNKIPWAHLDIAAPAFTDSADGYIKRGGVGFAVRTLVRWVESFDPATLLSESK